MKRIIVLIVILGLAGAVLPGCMTAAGEGIAAFRGAEGMYTETRPVADNKNQFALSQFGRIELGEFRDDFAGKVPPEFFPDLAAEFGTQLPKSKLALSGEGKTLLVQGRVIYFEQEGTLGKLLGPIEEVVAEVNLVDKQSGKVMGTAICVGRTTSRTTLGVQRKAEGLSRAILSWISDYYPKKAEKR